MPTTCHRQTVTLADAEEPPLSRHGPCYADIVKVLKDINLNVVSAEVDTGESSQKLPGMSHLPWADCGCLFAASEMMLLQFLGRRKPLLRYSGPTWL